MDVGGEEGGGGGVGGGGGGGGEGDVAARYERDLVHKLKLLRHELSLQQPQAGHCRIEVSREEIFEVGAAATNKTKDPAEGHHNISFSPSLPSSHSLSHTNMQKDQTVAQRGQTL